MRWTALTRPVVALCALSLAACGAASYSESNASAPSVAGARLAMGGHGPLGESVAIRATSGSRTSSRRMAQAKPAEAAPGGRAPAADASAPAADRYIVRSAFMKIERKDPEEGPKAAAEIAKRYGGWVQRTSNDGATIMVQAERLDAALDELAKLGKVVKRDVRGEDVTEEYLDLRIRLDNLEKSRARYLELLARAQTVQETLNVERELERVTLEIERLKGRINYLERVVRYSTIVLSFERPTYPGPVGAIFYGLFYAVKWLFVWE